MTMLGCLLLASLGSDRPVSAVAEAALRSGDELYERRAEGAQDGTALAGPVEAAMIQYRRALNLDPFSYQARLALLRALFFRGGFCDIGEKEQLKTFEEAKRLADDTVRLLETDLKESRLRAHRDALKREPLAAEIYLWAAVSWGQWASTHKLAAAWRGAAGQIRDLAQAVVDIEPTTLFGSGYLILGRLHAEVPRIPLVMRWVSREKAIEYLRKAYAIAPESSNNAYFLAQALLELEPTRRDEVRDLLERCATTPPRPEFVVEDAHYAEEARDLLGKAFGGSNRAPVARKLESAQPAHLVERRLRRAEDVGVGADVGSDGQRSDAARLGCTGRRQRLPQLTRSIGQVQAEELGRQASLVSNVQEASVPAPPQGPIRGLAPSDRARLPTLQRIESQPGIAVGSHERAVR
jgi:tetratricopeptide (TPR) repeat protein